MARLRADSEGFVLGTPRCVIGDGSGDSLRYRHPAQCHHGACNLAQVQVWSIGNIGSESGLPPPWRGVKVQRHHGLGSPPSGGVKAGSGGATPEIYPT